MSTKKKTSEEVTETTVPEAEEVMETTVPEAEEVTEATASDTTKEQEAGSEKNASDEKNEVPSEKNSDENSGNDSGYCCYIGPTIPKVIQKGSIFKGGKEYVLKHDASVAAAVEKCPLVSSLLIPAGELSVSLVKVGTKGNLLNEYYGRIADSFKK